MDARLTKAGERYTLHWERDLDHGPEKVWRALTERQLLRQWFPCDVIGEWKVGAPLQFQFLHGEGEGLPEEELRGEVLAVDPARLLEFRWGSSVIRCELLALGTACRLVFSEAFGDGSMGARSAAGWEWCLQNLDLVLQGDPATDFDVSSWQSRFDRYEKRFEPEAGPQQGMPEDHPAAKEQAALDP